MKNVIRVMIILALGYVVGMQALLGEKLSSYGPGILICAFLVWRVIIINSREAI